MQSRSKDLFYSFLKSQEKEQLTFIFPTGILDTGEVSPTDRADTTSLLSIDIGNNGDTSNNSVFTKLTPMKNSEHGALIPLSPGRQDDVMSDDSISIKVGKFLDKAKAETIYVSSMAPAKFQPFTLLSVNH